jgi:hypothetical protein
MSFHLHFPISHQEILLKADIGGLWWIVDLGRNEDEIRDP